MKRSGFKTKGTRKASTLRSKPLPRGTAPLKKVNPARQAKRRKSYAKKLAAYRRSETYRLVEQRAAGQCEAMKTDIGFNLPPSRCEIRRSDEPLQHHHTTYSRFGGSELPSDILVVCSHHHREIESKYPTRRRGR